MSIADFSAASELAADPVVCRCLAVRQSTIEDALATSQASSIRDLTRLTGAGDGCTACHCLLRDYLEQHRRRRHVK